MNSEPLTILSFTESLKSFFRWFKGVDWEEVYYRNLKPPIVPKVAFEGDTRNFDDYPETDWRKVPPVSERELRMFVDF